MIALTIHLGIFVLLINRKSSSFVIKLLLPILAIVLIIQGLIPLIAIHYAKQWYAEQGQGYELKVGDWGFNPWVGRLMLKDVELYHGEDTSSFHSFSIDVGILDLFERKVVIEAVEFDALKVGLAANKSDFEFLGLSTEKLMSAQSKQSTKQPVEQEQQLASDWTFDIHKIEFIQHEVSFTNSELSLSILLKNIEIASAADSAGLILSSHVSLLALSVPDKKINLHEPLEFEMSGLISSPYKNPQFEGDIQINNVKIKTPLAEQSGFERLTLSGLELSMLKQKLAKLTLEGLFIDDNFVALKQYTAKEISLDNNMFKVALNEWQGLKLEINLDKDGQVLELQEINSYLANVKASPTGNNPETSKTNADQSTAPIKVYVAELQQQVDSLSYIKIKNPHVDPNFNLELKIQELGISNINNQNEIVDFHLLAKADEYSNLRLEGNAAFEKDLSSEVKLQLDQFDLIAISGYLDKAIGYHVQQGQLNLDVNLNINKGALSGESKIKVVDSHLVPSDPEVMDNISKQISMPIETALSLIKDSNNNIQLSVPIKGNINAPDFGIDDLVSQLGAKAVTAATVHVVQQAIFPYGLLLSVADYVGSELFSISLTPIVFESEQLNEEQQQYLVKLVELMQEKKKLQLRVCAQVSAEDSKKEAWYETALGQAQQVKRYLVEKDNSLAPRITLCQAKKDDKTQILMGFL